MESSLDTEPLKRKSPLEQEHQSLLGSITGEHGARPGPSDTAAGKEPLHLSASFYKQIWILWSASPKFFWEVSMFNCLTFVLATPCPKLLTDCSSPYFQGQGTESSLCFEEVEVKYTFIFYCDLFRTTFYKMPCFIIVSGKESSIKIVLVWI